MYLLKGKGTFCGVCLVTFLLHAMTGSATEEEPGKNQIETYTNSSNFTNITSDFPTSSASSNNSGVFPPYPVYFFPSSGNAENDSDTNQTRFDSNLSTPLPVSPEINDTTTESSSVLPTTTTSSKTTTTSIKETTRTSTTTQTTSSKSTTKATTTKATTTKATTTKATTTKATTTITLPTTTENITSSTTAEPASNELKTTTQDGTHSTNSSEANSTPSTQLQTQASTESALPIKDQTTDSETTSSVNSSVNFTLLFDNTTVFLMQYPDEDFDSRDTFWPIAMALTIGIPTIIVFGVTIAVLYKRRIGKPRGLLSMYGQDY